MAKLMFGSTEETVVTQQEYPLKKARETLKSETISILGYGVQGPAQALNLRDNGFNVIIGQRKNSASWDNAIKDGWVPGETLFEIAEATKKGTIVVNLLSDAGQIDSWDIINQNLCENDLLMFFSWIWRYLS